MSWWPGESPEVPADDPVGRLAQRRITDAAACADPAAALVARAASYQPGDTDLAWTRITSWRTLLAATLDQPFGPATGGEVACEAGSPSAELLARWLETRLGITVERRVSAGPGITDVVLISDASSIGINRPDGRVAQLSRTGEPDREVSLLARDTVAIIAEEMRRLDPDEVYEEVLMGLPPAGRARSEEAS